MELRKTGAGSGFTLRGYAFRFGSTYDMGDFTEEVLRSAFNSADMTDVRVLDNHLSEKILGRTKSGTARVGIDDVGGWYEVDLPDSPNGHNMRASVERGDIDQSSWGFILSSNGDKWERRNGRMHRQLTSVSHWLDASPVTFPANPDTTVAKRSMDAAMTEDSVQPDAGGDTTAQSDKYDLAYVVGSLSSAILWANNHIQDLNYCADSLRMIGEDTDINPDTKDAATACDDAKAATVSLINQLSAILTRINSRENRELPKSKSKALDDVDFRMREMQLSQ